MQILKSIFDSTPLSYLSSILEERRYFICKNSPPPLI